jgi:hypothetical protein
MKLTWGQMPQMRVLFSQSAKIRFLFLTLRFRFYGVQKAASPPPATGVQFLCRSGRLRVQAERGWVEGNWVIGHATASKKNPAEAGFPFERLLAYIQ